MQPFIKKIKSFTLIEVLIAIVLISILASVIFACFNTSFKYLRQIIELRTANLILQEETSIVRNLTFQEIETLTDTFYCTSMSGLNGAAGTIEKSPYNGHDNIIKISFRLDWTSVNERALSKTITTVITDHGINKQ